MRNVALQHATSGNRSRPRSSDRVLQLLCAIGESPRGLSLTEAAASVGLVPSTALRQLRSLEAAGLLTRGVGDQLYRPGSRLVDLARTVFVGHSLATTAQPFLDDLASATGESAYLAVIGGKGTAVYVAAAPGQHTLRHTGWLGREFPSSATAVGAALRGRVDRDGAVTREGKLEPGITAVAAPVTSHGGVIAAINVVGPSFRLAGRSLSTARSDVIGFAGQLSAHLGDGPPR